MSRSAMLCLVIAVLALAPGVVLAQSPELVLSGVRVNAGWYDSGDFGDGTGFGVDFLNEVDSGRWVIGFEYRNLNPPSFKSSAGASKGAFGVDSCYGLLLGFEAGIGRHGNWDSFVGVAGSWHEFDNAVSDDAFGGRIYVGAEGGTKRQLEAALGLDLRNQVFEDFESDGLFMRVGYKVKF